MCDVLKSEPASVTGGVVPGRAIDERQRIGDLIFSRGSERNTEEIADFLVGES
jgi:hypothetical protein